MTTEQYPAMVQRFTKSHPETNGWYWWKENFSAEPEVVKFMDDSCGVWILRTGNDRAIPIHASDGFFGPEVTL